MKAIIPFNFRFYCKVIIHYYHQAVIILLFCTFTIYRGHETRSFKYMRLRITRNRKIICY